MPVPHCFLPPQSIEELDRNKWPWTLADTGQRGSRDCRMSWGWSPIDIWVGACTGVSAGLTPLRIWSACSTARWNRPGL